MFRSVNLATLTTSRTLASMSAAPRQILIGPAVRLLLLDYQIDPNILKPTGPKGNLLKSDLLTHISHLKLKPKPVDVHTKIEVQSKPKQFVQTTESQKRHTRQRYEDVPLKEAKMHGLTEAHYSLTSELVIDDLLKEIENLDSKDSSGKDGLLNDFVRKASKLACQHVPEADLVIEPLVSVSRGIVEAEKSEGRLQSNEFQISNLRSFGSVDHFTPTGSSQTYTLAVGGIQKRVVLADEGIRHVTTIKVTLSCDYRAVDTHIGAEWFRHFKRLIEHPSTVFL